MISPHLLAGFFVYRLIKYIEKKDQPKLGRLDRKKALKAEKKTKKSSSPVGSPNQSKTTATTTNGKTNKKTKAA